MKRPFTADERKDKRGKLSSFLPFFFFFFFLLSLRCLGASAVREITLSAPQKEDSPIRVAPLAIDELPLDPARRLEFEKALRARDYKRAETILVEEAERDPKSLRAAKLLTIAGGIFFLDGQFLNSAIAFKKADTIAPLDEQNRFTMAMSYIKLNRRDWAKPELEKLSSLDAKNALYQYWLARLDYDAKQY